MLKQITVAFSAITICGYTNAQSLFPQIEPVSFSQVQLTDNFWKPRVEKVATVTIPVCIDQTEIKTPRIRNYEKVARKKGEKHEGIFFDDSDVYKALEAMAYSLRNHPDPQLERKADEWIDKIAAAQQPDGYLNTYYTLNEPDKRWTDIDKHEDYCAGHLIEAGIAYYQTTGKRKLLDVAIRFADHIDETLRKPNKQWVSGHEEIELALVKLYRITKKKKYLDLAGWYVAQRGHGYSRQNIPTGHPSYCQDDLPVKDQQQIEGHAVRAMYLYTGVADYAAATNDTSYMQAMNTVWHDVVDKNMYITGGIGSSAKNEGFSMDYDLPNKEAYCETCASVGMVFWNQRMNLLTGDAKYIDILERSLYNGAIDGISLKGDRFFYGNPLASDGGYGRSEWFGTACCPSNIARLSASIGDYIYAYSPKAVMVNLFIGSNTIIPVQKSKVTITQHTNYPWDGAVQIKVSPDKKTKFPLYIRIPGWAKQQPVPGNTYTYLEQANTPVKISVNGKPVNYTTDKGYAVIAREWTSGDVVDLDLPMTVNRVVALDNIQSNTGRIALQRGPLVYCFEEADNGEKAKDIVLPDDAAITPEKEPGLLGGIISLQVNLPEQKFKAIPYYTWANRGNGAMQVWVKRKN